MKIEFVPVSVDFKAKQTVKFNIEQSGLYLFNSQFNSVDYRTYFGIRSFKIDGTEIGELKMFNEETLDFYYDLPKNPIYLKPGQGVVIESQSKYEDSQSIDVVFMDVKFESLIKAETV